VRKVCYLGVSNVGVFSLILFLIKSIMIWRLTVLLLQCNDRKYNTRFVRSVGVGSEFFCSYPILKHFVFLTENEAVKITPIVSPW